MRGHKHTTTILCLSILICTITSAWATGDYHGGSGTSADPYQIATAAELIELGRHTEDYGSHFILIEDIDMGINAPDGKIFRQAVIAPETDIATADYQGAPFTGTFDGNGRSVQNLTFQYTNTPYVGLFGMVAPSGTIANLVLENCTIQYAEYYLLGALAGENQGFIFNCAAGVVIEASPNPNYVGGLVGRNSGELVDCQTSGTIDADNYVGGLTGICHGGLIQECSSSCTVIGSNYIGGLIGRLQSDPLTIYSFATGNVEGNNYIGGLVGNSSASTLSIISQCYAAGDVIGSSNNAGLVGSISYTVVEYCYSTGYVSPSGYGLTGPLDPSTTRVSDSMWDVDTSGTTSTGGGTGWIHPLMIKKQTYLDANWDFDTVWTMIDGQTYPTFQWQEQMPIVLCRDGLPYSRGDLNKDCIVNLVDIQMLAENWLLDLR